jgi:hypothetical protein
MVAPTRVGITSPSSGSVPSALWVMLIWGAVGRWVGLGGVGPSEVGPPPPDTSHNAPIHNILATAPQLSNSQKARGTLPEDGNVMPKYVGATIHN